MLDSNDDLNNKERDRESYKQTSWAEETKSPLIIKIKVSQIYRSANWYPKLETTWGYCKDPQIPSISK